MTHYLTYSAIKKMRDQQYFFSEEGARLGILLDALILDPKSYDAQELTFTDRYGRVSYYTAQEVAEANARRNAFFADPLAAQLHKASLFQQECVNEGVNFEGFEIACKCIADGRVKAAGWTWDLKSTSCKSQAEFDISISRYDYDIQAYFSMQVTDTDKFMFVAVCKIRPYPVFKKLVVLGDDIYQEGEEKTLQVIEKLTK
jgi:hypothetical protein